MDKRCLTCKHVSSLGFSPRCYVCDNHSHWEQGGERIATGAALPRNDGEKVDHPQHYNHGKYECIDVMVDTFGKEAVQNFCLLNAFKYVWRSEHKNGIEDVKKAWWYLDKYLQLEVETHD